MGFGVSLTAGQQTGHTTSRNPINATRSSSPIKRYRLRDVVVLDWKHEQRCCGVTENVSDATRWRMPRATGDSGSALGYSVAVWPGRDAGRADNAARRQQSAGTDCRQRISIRQRILVLSVADLGCVGLLPTCVWALGFVVGNSVICKGVTDVGGLLRRCCDRPLRVNPDHGPTRL